MRRPWPSLRGRGVLERSDTILPPSKDSAQNGLGILAVHGSESEPLLDGVDALLEKDPAVSRPVSLPPEFAVLRT
jgi:hypothetical protein